MTPINLAVDHVSPIPLARIADVNAAIIAAPYAYEIAARKIGLSESEYAEFVRDIQEGDAEYGPLPRRIDAMSGRRRSGQVYALHAVGIPPDTMGWRVQLRDGRTVYIPRACGNLSMDDARSRRPTVATGFRNFPVPHPRPPVAVTFAPPTTGCATGWKPTNWKDAPGSYVCFTATPAPQSSPAPVIVAPAPSAAPGWRFSMAWLAPIWPIAAAILTEPRIVAPCSAGSNVMGVCR